MAEQQIEYKAKCVFILFENPNNHYVVARFECNDDTHGHFIGVGYLKQLERGALYRLQGSFVEHPKYGLQFQICSYERILSDDTDLLIRFISSSYFPGIGKSTAKRLVESLGNHLIEDIRKNANVLDQVEGINEKKKQIILQGLRNASLFDDDYVRLTANGFSNKQIARLEDVYGDDFIDVLKQDPYRPFFEIEGFSLRSCEKFAQSFAIDDLQERHDQANLLYFLKQLCFQHGSTYFPKDSFLETADRRFLDQMNVEEVLRELCVQGHVVEWNEKLYEHKEFDAEITIARKLKQLCEEQESPDEEMLLSLIKAMEEEFHIRYDERQIEAMIGFFKHSFLILNGGPGTGKTTTIRGVLTLYQRLYPNAEIILAAPTGRASKRLSELSSYPASTIHSLLKWDLETNTFLVDEKDPLRCDAVIVDEFSMVDNRLFAQLLKAIPANTKLLIIGDYDQLPSVSSGRVLYDLIQSKRFPLYSLQHIYRQADGSGIAALAAQIREEEPLVFDGDVSFIDCMPAQLRKGIIDIVKNALDKGYEAKDVQVLAPKYQGAFGIDLLNKDLQELLNPADAFKKEKSIAGKIFREGDKVLQLRNMREDAVYNGDIGEIIEIEDGLQGPVIVVAFDDQIVEYENETLYYLTHAYCISIHKSQGNEYPIVLLPIVSDYHFMLNRRLLYTAVTRAKSSLVLIGDRSLFEKALGKKEHGKRYTSLTEQLDRFFDETPQFPPIILTKPPVF